MRLLDKHNNLDMLDTLQAEIKELKETICAVKTDNKLRDGCRHMEEEILQLKKENKTLIETVIDPQYRSMSDNFFVAETLDEDVEEQVRDFFQNQLKLTKEEAGEITFSWVQRLGKKRSFGEAAAPTTSSSRPIIVKFNKFSQRLQIKYLGPRLKGKPLWYLRAVSKSGYGEAQSTPITVPSRKKKGEPSEVGCR